MQRNDQVCIPGKLRRWSYEAEYLISCIHDKWRTEIPCRYRLRHPLRQRDYFIGRHGVFFKGMSDMSDRTQPSVYDKDSQDVERNLLPQVFEGTAQGFLYFQAAADSKGYLPCEFVALMHCVTLSPCRP